MKMKPYQVKEGDNLWKIARDHGFQSEQDLLAVQENKDFFDSTSRNPHRIYPGDTIYIPPTTPHESDIKVNKKVVFRTPSKKGFVRLKVNDVEGNPVSKFKYEAEVYGQTFTGDETTHDGDIEIELPQKIENGRVLPVGELTQVEKAAIANDDDRVAAYTMTLKLYTDDDAPKHYELLRVHFNFNPNDSNSGQLQRLANEGEYAGFVSGTPYESNLRSYEVCYPKEDWSGSHLEALDEGGADLSPVPTTFNFQPQYYPVVWEALRFERLFALSRNAEKALENELERRKREEEPHDQTQISLYQAKMDKQYYQECFNYWFAEFSSIWRAHSESSYTVEAVIRLRSQALVDPVLNDLREKWRSQLSAETDKSKILELPFPEQDIEHLSPAKDIFTTYYSIQEAKDKLATTIVAMPLSTRVRFSYKDNPQEPIAHSYVLYWRYDKNDTNRIEKGREDYYERARIMMPIGIGKTDENGYLVQSLPLDDAYTEKIIHVEDERFALNSGGAELNGASLDFTQMFMARYEDNADYQKFINSIKAPEGLWNDIFNDVNSHTSNYKNRGRDLSYYYYRQSVKNYQNDLIRSTTFDDYKSKLLELKEERPERYKDLRLAISNHQFNFYSSGQTDTWGFMVYPPDGGLFRTKNLADLGNEGKYAYKGQLHPPQTDGDEQAFIELPCTLQEWERRIKVQNNKLRSAIEQYQAHTSSHQQNIMRLGRMSSLLDIYNKYPYEEESDEVKAKLESLNENVSNLTEAIQGITLSPDPDKDPMIHSALEDMRECREVISGFLNNSELKEHIKLYQDAYVAEEPEVSPYIDMDETWQSIYATLAETLNLMAKTPEAGEIADTFIVPLMDKLTDSPVIKERLEKGLPESMKRMREEDGDRIPINKHGDDIVETAERLGKRIQNIYIDAGGQNNNQNISSVFDVIFEHSLFLGVQETKAQLNQWINNTPGPNSILMEVFENYSGYLLNQAIKKGATKGYHIRLLLLISHGFGLFGDSNNLNEMDIVQVLRADPNSRIDTKIKVLQAQRNQMMASISARQERIASLEERAISATPGERVSINKQRKKLEGFLLDELAEIEGKSLEIEYKKKIQKEIQSGRARDLINARQASNTQNVDELYQRADGRSARVYKTVLWGVTVAGLVEDWVRLTEINKDPSLPNVDVDIVMAHYAKTITDTASAFTSAMVLINRWVSSERSIFNVGALSSDVLNANADKLAVVASVITLYISSRDLYETYNNKTMLEKTKAVLDMTANAVTTIGYVITHNGARALMSPLLSSILVPGLGQALLIIGVIITIVRIGIDIYEWWQGYEFRRDAPVGFYFWQEYELIRETGQRYADEVEQNSDDFKAYSQLQNSYENDSVIGNHAEDGWGFLSWRGAVPLFVAWSEYKVSESKLIDIVSYISMVPELDIPSTASRPYPLTTVDEELELLSPEVFVEFYLHLKKEVNQGNDCLTFTNGGNNLSYQAVINQLEQGVYIPSGETDEVIEQLKGVVKRTPGSSGGLSVHYNQTRHVIWDHQHFRNNPNY